MAKGLNVKVKMKNLQLLKLSRAQIKAFEMTADALKTEINLKQVTPKAVGDLEKSPHIVTGMLNKGNLRLQYDLPYTRRLYYHPEYNFRKDKNPNAQGLWLEPFIDGEFKNLAPDTFNKFYRKEARGALW